MAVIVVVDARSDGFGDLVFADKIAGFLRERYDLDVRVVARDEMAEAAKQALGLDLVKVSEFKPTAQPVDLVLEAPVYGPNPRGYFAPELDLLHSIGVLTKASPLLMMSEYGCKYTSAPHEFYSVQPPIIKTYETGFAGGELGVLQQKRLRTEPGASENRDGLVYCYRQQDFQHYMRLHNLYSEGRRRSSAAVYAMGPSAFEIAKEYKRKHGEWHVINAKEISAATTLQQVKDYISTKKLEHPGKVLFCFQSVSPEVFQWLMANTGDLVGVRGDQSFVEALELGKLPVYSCARHKVEFYQSYLAAMRDRLSPEHYQCLTSINPEIPESIKYDVQFGRRDMPPPKLSKTQCQMVRDESVRVPGMEAIKRAHRHLLQYNNLMCSLAPTLDCCLLAAKVRRVLSGMDGARTVRVKIRHFLDAIERGAPTRSKRFCGIFGAVNRQRIDDFILRARIDCASGSIRTQDLPAVFAKSLNELMQVLIKNERKSAPSRSIRCIMDAAKTHFCIDFDRTSVAEDSDLARAEGVETKPVC